MTSTLTHPDTEPRSVVARRAAVIAGAVTAAALAWVVIVPLLGTDVTVPESPSSDERVDLGIVPVVVMATLASLAGWALLTVLERFTARALTVWTVIAALVLVATMPWDAAFTGSERVALVILHLAVGVPLILGFRAVRRPTDR